MNYYSFKELFAHICEIKSFVLQLSMKDLRNYKIVFYSQKVPYWTLNIMWEFIWGDKDYETMQMIFINAKLIKEEQHEIKRQGA